MTTLIFLLLAAAAIPVAYVTVHAFRHAETGYEDESGFHRGRPPLARPRTVFVRAVKVTCRCGPPLVASRTLERAPSSEAGH